MSGIDLSIGHSDCLSCPARLGVEVEVQVEVQLLARGVTHNANIKWVSSCGSLLFFFALNSQLT